jgi:hypothetical protein
VQVLQIFENKWSLAKTFLDDESQLKQLNWFANLLEDKSEKYSDFKESVECRDSIIFITIPSLLILTAA